MNNKTINQIITNLIEIDIDDYWFYRSFIEHSDKKNGIGSLRNQMNSLMTECPETINVILGLYLYPVVKWIVKYKDIQLKAEHFTSKNFSSVWRFFEIQNILREVSGIYSKLQLPNRTEYFAICEEFLSFIDSMYNSIISCPDFSCQCESVLSLFLNRPIDANIKKNYATNYGIRLFSKKVILLVTDCYKKEFDTFMEKLLIDDSLVAQDQYSIYHNTEKLLSEYNRILWKTQNFSDKAVQLLNCKNALEMDDITQSDEKYSQANLIVEYIKVIYVAIESVKDFPVFGKEYYKILSFLTNYKKQGLSDKEIAVQLQMSDFSYSVKKRRALSVLSSILWGGDMDTFIKLLTSR